MQQTASQPLSSGGDRTDNASTAAPATATATAATAPAPAPNPASTAAAASIAPGPTAISSELQTATSTTTTGPKGPDPSFPPQFPRTSLQDSGKTRRPRDVRLIHMLLASKGVTSYQERVPLQILDFAYRHTSSTLQDAVYLATEGYAGGGASQDQAQGQNPDREQQSQTQPQPQQQQQQQQRTAPVRAVNPNNLRTVSIDALKMSIASKLPYQFRTAVPRDFLMELAAERNRIILPGTVRGFAGAGPGVPGAAGSDASGTGPAVTGLPSNSVLMGGVRLPPERFCQTGLGWGFNEEWESDGEEEEEDEQEKEGVDAAGGGANEVKNEDEDGDEDMAAEDGDEKMEDVFGE